MVLENARTATRALRVNKLRSALTMLGIIIGVGAIIAVVAVGAGAHARVTEQIQSLGSNLLIVLANSVNARGVRAGGGSGSTLTEDDAYAIQREIPAVQAAAPTLASSKQVVHGNLNWGVVVAGVKPEWLEVKEWSLVDGRPITADDYRTAAKVVLLGQTAAANLFGGDNPIGSSIRISRVPFTVIGVLERKGQNTSGQDQDDIVMVPLSTGRQKLFGRVRGQARAVWVIVVKVRDGEDLGEAEASIPVRAERRQRHAEHRIGIAARPPGICLAACQVHAECAVLGDEDVGGAHRLGPRAPHAQHLPVVNDLVVTVRHHAHGVIDFALAAADGDGQHVPAGRIDGA